LRLFYELAVAVPKQAVLSGSATMLAAADHAGIDMATDEAPAPPCVADSSDARPLLAIIDSAGQITRFAWLRAQPYWRDVIVICSAATPPEHLARLRERHVEYLIAGDQRVDLAAALELLAERYGIDDVRVDAGPTLNGLLVRQGLVDSLSLLLAPRLVGDGSVDALRLVRELALEKSPALKLVHVERLRGDHVWLRYCF
jgi:2,5-diamino-6-(ribosylamino)-4(3H)-pyrimidinone 5'-phosphate reductase